MARTANAIIIAIVLQFSTAAVFAGTGSPDDPLIFGIVPARSPDQLLQQFGPMISELESSLGISVRLRGAPNYKTFVDRVTEGSVYDFVLSGGDTFHYARKHSGYVPVAKMKSKGVFAVFAVSAVSTFQDIDDLVGDTQVATADRLAYSTGLGLRALRAAGVDPETDIQLVEVPNQSASLMTLVRGQVDAAIIMIPVFRSAGSEIKDGLRIIAETERAPPPLISASKDLPDQLIEDVKAFFLDLDKHSEGQEILKNIAWPGFEEVIIEEYDQLDWASDSIENRLKTSD